MPNIRRRSLFYIFTFVSMFSMLTPIVNAQTVRPNGTDDSWYFTLGGSDPYVNYHQSNRTNINLSAGAEWSLMRSCTFDPRTSIAETFSDAQRSIYGLANDVVAAAPGLLTSWGLSKVQENYPGVYDFLTKGLVDAKASYQVAIKSCQDMRNDVKNGRDPVDGWFRVSKTANWDTAASTGENPTHVGEGNGNNGIVWANGTKRGGLDQEPIRSVADTIEAGYFHMTNGLAEDPNDDPVNGSRNISRVFPNANAAAKWTAAVVGEREIRTCDGCEKLRTKVGQGLRLKHKEERDAVAIDMNDALNAPKLTSAMLNKLSVPGMGIVATEGTIRAIKDAPSNEQRILATRYVSEIALARVMEKGLIAKDLFNMGEQEPNISANGEAQNEIEFSKKRLEQELENIMFENDVRKKVINNAATTLAEREEARAHHPAGNQLKAPTIQSHGMTGGGVNAP